MFEAAGDFIETEIFGDSVHAPRPGIGFERPDQQFAGIVLVVPAIVVIAQHRQAGINPFNPFEQHVIMLAGVERRSHADTGRKIAGPHPAADHHIVSVDCSFGGFDPGCAGAVMADPGNLGVLENPRPAAPCALGQSHRDIDCIGIAIAGNVDPADHVIDIDDAGHVLDLLRGYDMDRQIEDLGHRGAALQLLKPFGIGRHRDRTALTVTGCLPGLGFQPAVELAGVLGELGHVDRRAQLANQPGRMPSRAAGQLLTFEQHDIVPPDLGQMIGDRAADHPAAYDDNAGLFGKLCHRTQAFILALSGS